MDGAGVAVVEVFGVESFAGDPHVAPVGRSGASALAEIASDLR
jgi:hypothetical protein